MTDYEKEKIKYLIEYLRDINYFDCVDRPSSVQYKAKEAADCIEELFELAVKSEENKDLAECRLKRKNMYKERSARDLMEKERYRLDLEQTHKELEEVESKLSELLSYMTGGRFSKTTYAISDMKRFVDDYTNDLMRDECANCDK